MVVPRLLFTYIKTRIRNSDAGLLGVYFSNNNTNVLLLVSVKRIASEVASAQIADFIPMQQSITWNRILDIPMVQKGKFSAGADELVMALKKVDFL
jgi:hypothetical protein